MRKALFGLAAILLAAMAFTGCGNAAGGTGAPGLPAATATTARGVKAYFDEGHTIVYFVGDLVLGSGAGEEAVLDVPSGKTLILADLADLNSRAVSASGKGSITVKTGGTLNVTSAKLVVPNGTKVTVAAGTGTVNLTGAATVIVGTPGVVPAAADAPVFAIKGGTVTASSTATLSFTSGATLEKSGGTLTAASGTAFAFEDPADLDTTVVEAIAAAGSTALNVGGTIDADGKVEVGTGTTIDPHGGASFESGAEAFLTALSGSAVLVSYTGAETVNSTGNYNLTGRAVSLTNPAAELVIGTGTVTVAGGAGVSMWAPFSGAGKITVSGTGTLAQDSNFGIGTGKELVLTTTSKVTYDLSGNTLTVAGTGTEGAGTVTVTSSDGLNLTRNLTIAAGATLILGANHINLYAPVTLTVNGTLDASATTGTITLVPGSTLTVGEHGTVNALGSTTATGAILLGGSPATGIYTVNGTGRIKLSGTAVGPLFAVAASQTLAVTGVTLDGLSIQSDITAAASSIAELTGRAAALTAAGFTADAASNTFPLVTVTGASAVLTLNTGAKVAGNTLTTASGQKEGAGVKITTGGRLNICGGEVSYNTIVGTSTGFGGGAGVFADNGSIVMTGGSVSRNYIVANATGTSGTTGSYGAGVAVVSESNTGSTFTLSGGSISDNFIGGDTLCEITGGGVRVGHYINDYKPVNTFTMTGGSITGNKLLYSGSEANGTSNRTNNISGSAVAVTGHNTDDQYISKFIMSGGTISGNTITASTRTAYGAVYAFGLLDMSGGVIENNVATSTKSEPAKGVMAVAPKALILSGSAKLKDGITMKAANSATWEASTYPKITVGTLSNDFEVSVLHLQARYDQTYNYSDWPNGVVLTGTSGSAVAAIARFPLGNFIITKNGTQSSDVTPISTANGTGYELTREGETQNVKLTAKAGG